jgi:predicted lipoprotein with Yx(FWY)xxD motif
MNQPAGEHVPRGMGSKWGSSLPRRSVSGTAGAALLVASGAIHLDLYLTGYRTIPTIGWLFLLQVISGFALALAIAVVSLWPRALVGAEFTLAAASGALFGLATLGGYLLSLRIGLFGFTEVRTTAGIVAGVIDVAIFAALAVAIGSGPVNLGALSSFPARRAFPAIAVVSVVALALLAADVANPKTQVSATTATGSTVLQARDIGGEMVLTDAKGRTLYSFAPDSPTKSACYGSCAAYWPPVTGTPSAGPGVTGKLGTIKRTDGTTQVTYDGHPLYTYIADNAPGQDNGNNINLNGGLWRVVPVSAG